MPVFVPLIIRNLTRAAYSPNGFHKLSRPGLEPATPRWESQHSNLAATPTCFSMHLAMAPFPSKIQLKFGGELWSMNYFFDASIALSCLSWLQLQLSKKASIKMTFIATTFGLFEEFHIWLTVTTGKPVAGMISLLNP